MVKCNKFRILWKTYDVPIRPGYAVPPTIRPRGYQERSSIQSKNSYGPDQARNLVAR